MTNLQQLLEEKYPNSEISEIQRRAFLDGWNAAISERLKPQDAEFLAPECNPDKEKIHMFY